MRKRDISAKSNLIVPAASIRATTTDGQTPHSIGYQNPIQGKMVRRALYHAVKLYDLKKSIGLSPASFLIVISKHVGDKHTRHMPSPTSHVLQPMANCIFKMQPCRALVKCLPRLVREIVPALSAWALHTTCQR